MPFTVETFISKLRTGGARQNLFEVIMPFPAVAGTPTGGPDLFSFMCKSASLPPEELGVIPVPYFGRQIKIPGDRTFPEWQISVINDEDFGVRDVFERWSNALNGHYSNLRNPNAINPADAGGGGYATNATVIQYSRTGEILKEYDFIGMWPSSVTPQDLAWDANDQIEEFQVSLQYNWWEARTTI